MNNDLISRSKLIETIKATDVTYNPHFVILLNSLVSLVEEQPTAYDVDKVIEELNYIEIKWDKSCPPPNEYGEPMCAVDCVECQIRRCKDVVKRGGVYDI